MKKKDFVLVLVFFAVLSTKCLLLYNDEERKKERKKERKRGKERRGKERKGKEKKKKKRVGHNSPLQGLQTAPKWEVSVLFPI